jgi:predicted nucleotidyltransferase
MSEPYWERNVILKLIAGDQTYGLDEPGQRLETRAVCIPPRRAAGENGRELWEHSDEHGHVLTYALDEFVRRALACDPATIELLYTPPRYILFANAYGRRLLAHRDLFLSMRARHAFAGAALQHIKRIEQHRHWQLDPPDREPTPEAFGGDSNSGRLHFPDPGAQQAYQAAREEWEQYQAWRQDQDLARAAREEKYGYDTSEAMQAIRLLAMGSEILETSLVHVYRHDREWLRSVRDGSLLYDELLDLVTVCQRRHERLSRLSSLPDAPDAEAAWALAAELEEGFLSGAQDPPPFLTFS